MQLDQISAEIRPRSAWEAIDLGFVLARHWFWHLLLLWMLTAAPLFITVHLLLGLTWQSILLLWWLKPIYEPVLIYWLSRRLFSENLSMRSLLKQLPSILRKQTLGNLLWRRLSPNRSFNYAVSILEGLKGKAKRERLQILHRQQHAGAWLTIIGIHFESILNIAMLLLLALAIPSELEMLSLRDFFIVNDDTPAVIILIAHLCNFIAMAIIAPFYVCAGFTLYLAKRTELEAWDIEIQFRRLRDRLFNLRYHKLSSLATCLVLGLLLVFSMPPASHADAGESLDAQQAKQLIDEVLQHKDFGQREIKKNWQYTGQPSPQKNKSWDFSLPWLEHAINIAAHAARYLLWISAALLLIFLLLKLSASRGWFISADGKQEKQRARIPVQLMSMILKPESLPIDVVDSALRYASTGRMREALSMLYRASLSYLISQYELNIPVSATENECRDLIRQTCPHHQADFFSKINLHWIRQAYGHIGMTQETFEQLCHQWQAIFIENKAS